MRFTLEPVLGEKFPEDYQYLGLLKSRFILEQLESSNSFRSTGLVSLWAEYMRQLQ